MCSQLPISFCIGRATFCLFVRFARVDCYCRIRYWHFPVFRTEFLTYASQQRCQHATYFIVCRFNFCMMGECYRAGVDCEFDVVVRFNVRRQCELQESREFVPGRMPTHLCDIRGDRLRSTP